MPQAVEADALPLQPGVSDSILNAVLCNISTIKASCLPPCRLASLCSRANPSLSLPMLEACTAAPSCIRAWRSQSAPGVHRVIALAQRQLAPEESSAAEMRGMARSDAEARLQLVGFAVLSCPLKPESAPALQQLRGASHQLVMITGDAALTACHAAAELGITDRPTLILSHTCAP